MKQFCDNQIKCEEDKEETWTCMAHLAEARAMQCPYQSAEDAKRKVNPCEDIIPV